MRFIQVYISQSYRPRFKNLADSHPVRTTAWAVHSGVVSLFDSSLGAVGVTTNVGHVVVRFFQS